MVLEYSKFKVLDQTVELFYDQTAYGFDCIGIVEDYHHSLGDIKPSLDAAMLCWEKQYRPLSAQEREQVLTQNKLLSE